MTRNNFLTSATLIAGILLSASTCGHAAESKGGRLEYSVTARGDETSSFSCIRSSSNVCVVLVGQPSDAKAEKIEIPQGVTTTIPNPKGMRHYCVMTGAEMNWPDCLRDPSSNALSNSRSSSQFQWGGSNKD